MSPTPTRRNRLRPTRFLFAFAAAATAVALAGDLHAAANDDRDDRGCRFLDGPFSSNLVSPPECASPVGMCTHGQLGGDFPAVYDFTFSTLQSAHDPTDPTEYVYTGHSTITTPRGVLQTNDSGVLHLNAGAPSPFVTTASIASGTGRYAAATGVFVAKGNLDLASGAATGTFVAQICGASRAIATDGDGD